MTEEVKQVEITDLTSEQVFDMLPYAVEIYEKVDFENYRKKIQEDYKKKKEKKGEKFNYYEAAVDASISGVKHILKNSPKIKEEIFSVVSIAEFKSIEEVKKQSIVKTFKTFKAIFANEELVHFFKSAMQ